MSRDRDVETDSALAGQRRSRGCRAGAARGTTRRRRRTGQRRPDVAAAPHAPRPPSRARRSRPPSSSTSRPRPAAAPSRARSGTSSPPRRHAPCSWRSTPRATWTPRSTSSVASGPSSRRSSAGSPTTGRRGHAGHRRRRGRHLPGPGRAAGERGGRPVLAARGGRPTGRPPPLARCSRPGASPAPSTGSRTRTTPGRSGCSRGRTYRMNFVTKGEGCASVSVHRPKTGFGSALLQRRLRRARRVRRAGVRPVQLPCRGASGLAATC